MLLSLEEYITKRKKKDRINDFKLEDRNINVQTCINYVFDYYFKYLERNAEKTLSSKHQFNLRKFKDILEHKYDPVISVWLIDVYDKYEKRLDVQITHFVEDHEEFHLCYCDVDFQTLADTFCKNNRTSMPFLSDYNANIKDFIKYSLMKESNESYNGFVLYQLIW